MDVARALRDGDLESALAEAVAWWRDCRRHDVATLVNGIAAEMPPALSDDDLETLLAAPAAPKLDAALARIIDPRSSPKTLERLQRLFACWPDDPRLTDHILRYFAEPPWDLTSDNPRRLFAFLVARLAEMTDDRILAWVNEREVFFQARRGRRFGQLSDDEIVVLRELFASHDWRSTTAASWAPRASARLDEARLALDERRARREKDAEVGRELLSSVMADLSDLDAHRVYADWLLDRHDPQGELIMLSLQDDPRSKPRRAVLVKAVSARLPESLRKCKLAWKNGFVSGVQFKDGDRGYRGDWGEELDWGTVQSADLPPSSDACRSDNLEQLTVATTYLKRLKTLQKPLPVTHLTWLSAGVSGRGTMKKQKVLDRLREVTLEVSTLADFTWLFELPLMSLVTQVNIRGSRAGLVHVPSYFAASPTLERVDLAPSSTERVEIYRGGDGLVLVLQPSGGTRARDLATLFDGLARPIVAEVVVRGARPSPEVDALLSLGERGRLEEPTP